MHIRSKTRAARLGLSWGLLVLGAAAMARADSVDDYLTAEMAKRHLPSLTVAVARDGQIIKTQAYGLADLAAKTPATVETVYGLGSCTKPITAVAVLQLVESGKVRLDAPISAYLPGLPDTWKAITVRQLLTHTSGLPNYRLSLDYRHLARYKSPGSVLQIVRKKPLDFAPGTRYEYSNTNYHLLAQLIEKVSGQPYAQFLVRRLFQPAGLLATCLADPPTPIPHLARGYLRQDDATVPNTLIFPAAINSGDSGLRSTAADLAHWCLALDAGKLLTPATLRQMETRGTLTDGTAVTYGLGWTVGAWNGHRLIAHSGAEPGYSSSMFRFPDDRLVVVLLSNVFDGTALTDSLALGLSQFYLPAPPPLPAPAVDPEPKTTALVRRVLTDLAAGKAEAAYFTPAMSAALTPAVITQTNQNLAAGGAFQPASLVLVSVADDGGLRAYRYQALYGSLRVLWTVHMAKDGRIAGMVPQAE